MERNRLTLLLSLFLVLAGPAQAQTAPVQKLVFAASGAIPPAATVNAAFPNPIGSALGETCIVFAAFEGGSGTMTATSVNNTWTLGASIIESDVQEAIFYAQPCKSGPDMVSVSRPTMPRYTWGFIAEYTGLGTLDTTGANHMGCDDATVQMMLAGQNETIILGFLEHGESGLTVTPSAGLTLETPGLSFGLIDGTATNSGSYTAGFDFGGPNLTFAPTWTALALAFEPPGPLQIPFVGSNGGSGFVATFPIASLSQIPACGPNDGACSLTLQITDGNGNVITSGSAGSVAIVKTFSGGTLTVPIVTIAPR